jgi:hypothetical protein
MVAHPYALLDQVVLVRLELVLQPVLLLLCLARLLLCPGRVEQRGGILRRDGAELIDQRRLQLDVLALLGLRNGEAVGVDGEVRRVGANVVEAVSAGEAWVGLAEGYRTCFWGTRQHSCQYRTPGRTWVHLRDLAELSQGVWSQDGQAIVPVTMVAPLARICWKKGDCSMLEAMAAVEWSMVAPCSVSELRAAISSAARCCLPRVVGRWPAYITPTGTQCGRKYP